MIPPEEKYNRRGKGFAPIEKPEPAKKHKYPKDCFNPDEQKNWLFNDNPVYTKKRKRKKKNKKTK